MTARAGTFSRLFFQWVSPFIERNVREPLVMDSLLQAPPAFDAHQQLSELKRSIQAVRPGALILARALLHCVRFEILRTIGCAIIMLVSGLSTPVVLRELLKSLEGHASAPAWLAHVATVSGIAPQTALSLGCVILLFLLSVAGLIAVHHLWYIQVGISIRAQTALRALIYEKALRLDRSERGEASSGAIITLMGTDTAKILGWLQFLHSIWYHPLQVAIALALLYSFVGVAALYGTASLAIPLIAASTLMGALNRLRREILKINDQRVGFTAEVLGHIKTVKFQAWERPLSQHILKFRAAEVRRLRRANLLASLAGLASNLSPALAMLVTFSVYALRGGTLEPEIVFPTMSIILLLRFALNSYPDSVINLLEALISASRIQLFLNRREYAPCAVIASQTEAIRIRQATFEWAPSEKAITVGTLNVQPGELVAVVGAVGSGKSALLLSILGELSPSAGDVSVNGDVGYVSQQPWIVSDTIRNNILAGAPLDSARYERALSAAALNEDLALMPEGDATLIGERGVNLSGGQRQRVALARAAYAHNAIYLLDDPLSALDPGVANEVFDRLVCGVLQAKARLLVTHRLEYALRADRVVVVERGAVVESGPPQELRQTSSRFAALLEFHDEISGETASGSAKGLLDVEPGEKLENDDAAVTALPGTSNRSIVEAEERDVGAVTRSVFVSYLKRFIPGLVAPLFVAVVLLRHAASVSSDLWLATFSQGNFGSAGDFVLGYATLLSVLAVLHFSRWLLFLGRGLHAGQESHANLLRGVLAAPMRFFEANPVGRVLNRFSRDLDAIETWLPRALQDTCHCLLDVVVVFIFAAVLEPRTLFILVPVALLYARASRLFRPTAREAQRLESIARSPVFALFSESIAGTETIRTSRLTQRFEASLARYLNALSNASFSILASNRWLGIRLELWAACVLLATGICLVLVPSSSTTSAIAGLLLTYTLSFTGTMNWMVRSFVMAEGYLTSYERIEFYASTAPESRLGAPAPDHWPSRGELRLEGLTVGYRPDLPPALAGLTCCIPAGNRVGIVGRSGSGKSTLILALGRLLEPSSGHVEIDGVNTSTLTLEALRTAITVVPQEPVLFSGQLRDTLDPFKSSSDSEIMTALQRVELDRFVAELPGGLQAVVQEGGSNFSCGQRQLLCLARALLRESKVIVLDEATANIDVETDYAIQRTIRREFAQATVLVVAHRLGTVIDSDLMLVLDGGKLSEFGPPDQLLSSPTSALSSFVRELQQGAA